MYHGCTVILVTDACIAIFARVAYFERRLSGSGYVCFEDVYKRQNIDGLDANVHYSAEYEGRLSNFCLLYTSNISTAGKPSFEVRNTRKDCDASVSYKDYGATVIHDNGKKTELKDEVPELEI